VQRKHLRFGIGFRVGVGNARGQAAEMVIRPGDAEGDATNSHRRADQYLYVLSGTGRAVVNGAPYPLRRGTLLLIEHGDKHEIRNTGRTLLRTLNFYTPPAYSKRHKELAAARP